MMKKKKRSKRKKKSPSRKKLAKKKDRPFSKEAPQKKEHDVKQEYLNLQEIYKQVVKKIKEKNDTSTLKELTEFKERISSHLHQYSHNPSKLHELSDEISGGIEYLKSIDSPNLKGALMKNAPTSTDSFKLAEKAKGNILEKYEIELSGARATIEIIKDELGISYNLFIPQISIATKTLLNDIRNELISITTISMKELTDPKLLTMIKEKFMKDATRLIKTKLPNIDLQTERFLIGNLMQEMLGLGKIEFLIDDASLEEIVITSSKEPIRVYSKKYGWLITNILIEKEEDIINYANIIARRVGRQINILNPLLDAHLLTGRDYPAGAFAAVCNQYLGEHKSVLGYLGTEALNNGVYGRVPLKKVRNTLYLYTSGTLSFRSCSKNELDRISLPSQ